MADETIVIEIKDGIDSSIVAKIKGIAKAARTAHSEISGFAKQFDSLNKAAAAVSKLELANEKLAAATHRADAAALGAAVNEQRLAAARARTAAETSKASQAALRLSEAQARVTERAARAAAAQQAAANAATNQAKAFDKAGISVKQYNAAMRGVPAQITDIVVSLQGGQAPLTVLLQQGGQLKDMFGGIKPAAAALGRSLVALVNPFTIAAAALAAFGVAIGMAESKLRDLNRLSAQFGATGRSDVDNSFIAGLTKQIAELPGVSKSAAEAVIGEFAKIRTITVPVFQEATKSVANLAVALGTDVPKAAEFLAESLGDPLKGAIELDKRLGILTATNFKTIDGLVKMGKTAEAQKLILSVLNKELKDVAINAMTPLERATDRFGNAFGKLLSTVGNSGPLRAAAEGLGKIVDGLTWCVEQLDKLFSMKVPPWLSTGLLAGAGGAAVAGPIGALAGFAGGSLLGAGATAMGAGKSDANEAPGNKAAARSAAQLKTTDDKLKEAGLKKDSETKAAESRARAIEKLNAQLQNELTLLELLGDSKSEYEMQSRIEEALIGRGIKLSESENEAIQKKITLIVSMNATSAERNRIYAESIQGQKEFDITLKAANELLADGMINQDEYTRQIEKASRALVVYNQSLEDASSPLAEISRQMSNELALTKFLGNAYEDQAKLQGILNQLREKGIKISDTARDALLEEIALVRQRVDLHSVENNLINQSVTARQQQANQILAISNLTKSGNGGYSAGDSAKDTSAILQSMGVDPSTLQIGLEAQLAQFETYYAQLNQMRQAKLISEQDAAKVEAQLWMQQQDARFASTKQFFTGLEGLQNSKSKKIAAIGRAAAIAKAIIDTYTSATGAYASLSSIPYVGPALGAAAAAAAIAAGMANVQAIRSQGTGFRTGGYTGNGSTHEEAGPVHRREFVFDAPAVDRIGVENLEAMRQGRNTSDMPTGSANSGSSASTTNKMPRIINVIDPAMIGDYLGTPEGEQTLINLIRRNSDSVKAAVNG